MNVLDCLLFTTHRTVFSLDSAYSTRIAKHVHIVLISLVALVLDYEISAPQDPLDIKKTLKVSLSPPKEGVLRIFHPKNPTASAAFEPVNLGTESQHATHRPPKLLSHNI